MGKLAQPFLILLGWSLGKSPAFLASGLCRFLGWIVWRFSDRRHTILSALAHSFPDRDASWRCRIARTNCARMFEMFLLSLALPHMSRRRRGRIRLHPSAIDLFEGSGKGHPLVLAIPHSSLMEALALIPEMHPDVPPVVTLYRPLDFAPAEQYVRWSRQRWGVRMVSRRDGLLQAKQQLQSGHGIAAMLFDQSAGSQGHLMLFFNRVCSTTNLPGLLAARTGARPYLLYCRRTAFWSGEIEARPLPLSTRSAEVMTATQRELENLLSENDDACADWFWAHKRWKGLLRPSQVLTFPRRKSYLKEQMRLLGLRELPRNSRFAFRLSPDPALLPAAAKLVQVVRCQRPDALIWLLAPESLPSDALPPHDRLFTLSAESSRRSDELAAANDAFVDALFVLDPSRSATAEARKIHCDFRAGLCLAGAPHGIYHASHDVVDPKYRSRPWATIRRLLHKLELTDEEIATILRENRSSAPLR